jgi:hypothetical protein
MADAAALKPQVQVKQGFAERRFFEDFIPKL